MKLIKDLGMHISSDKNEKLYRFGMYECPVCKKHFRVRTSNVKNGKSTKCKACHMEKSFTFHGGAETKLYEVWINMKRRCYSIKNKCFNRYGGRGIVVCDEWRTDFSYFRDWALENGYEESLSIDRIDNDGNYEPNNCRWTTQAVQSRNTAILRSTNTSGYRGVSWNKENKRWVSKICVNFKTLFLGYFDYPYTAGYAYDSYVVKHNLEHTKNFKSVNK